MIKLGDRVTTTTEAWVRKGWDQGWHRRWVRRTLREPVSGIVVGIRTVKEGESVYMGAEEGSYFAPTKHLQVYLVAINMKQIIRVMPEDIILK